MMRYYDILITLILTMALWLGSTQTHAFDLFEADRGKPPPPPPPLIKQSQIPNPFRLRQQEIPHKTQKSRKAMPPQKDFFLRGTSRIGDFRSVILKGPDNKDFIQHFNNNGRTLIEPRPDYPYKGYYLLVVEAREVKIEYPAESPCRKSNEKKGLTCSETDGGKTALLALTQSKALPTPKPRISKTKKAADAKKRREEKRKKRQEQYKNFKRKVIKDEDVPEGMRVVRTPFGDRLVPKK
jgi:hypothetical protein